MTSRPRVCLATDSREPSGVGRHLLDLASMDERMADVTVLAHASTGLLDRCALPADALPDDLPAYFAARRFDLVHVHAGIGWEGHGLVRAAAGAGTPVVRTEHLPWLITDPGQRDEYLTCLPAVDRVVAVSRGVADSYAAAGVPREQIDVVLNGRDAPQPDRAAADVRAELGVAGPLLLHVGRCTPQKRHDLLVAAMPSVLAAHPDTVLAIVGTGPERPRAEQLARDLGVADQVRFLGNRPDVADLMGAADLFVLPSDFEGLPLVLLEAMALGVPVVATRVCGIAEVLDADTARVVEPGDAAPLAAAIVAALDDPDGTAARAAAGRRRHAERHTLAAMQRNTLDLYRRVLRKDRS